MWGASARTLLWVGILVTELGDIVCLGKGFSQAINAIRAGRLVNDELRCGVMVG